MVTPQTSQRGLNAYKSPEHSVASRITQHVPKSMRGQSDILDQVVGGFTAHSRKEQSKISVAAKGRVVVGYRETEDEDAVRRMGLGVGMQGTKKKPWWK